MTAVSPDSPGSVGSPTTGTPSTGAPRIVLAIDTATVVCAALARDGQLLASGRVDDTRAHVERLVPLVTELCEQAGIALTDVTDVAVGVGPGPFTGLRVGVVTALTLAALAGTTARGVCTLDIAARQYVLGRGVPPGADGPADASEFVAAIDARRKELYWARYDADGTRLDGPFVGPASELPDLPVVGPGAGLAAKSEPDLPLDVAVLAQVPDTFTDAGLEPLYLRKPDAEVSTSRKSALQPGVRLSLKGNRR
ncbi:tRNA (adenosine(37)-N6)-threonylcarbamoyltransferase complex dimerization subunit type 1 TsaB [Aestuariimicrobium soli]|uniref:tRNA (adenosine(37)-N6)-threonylcarbamoyltransferase complex dimerization subunit type 1 TsaB n=1 Tax=Aestuariimicrobium soli TaxID=2035834 RepID=UPI003EC119D0